jgi:hypothetical protein
LHGLEANAKYRVTDLDTGAIEQYSGLQLMQDGVPITIEQCPSAPVLLYEKVR